jgi:hypothetical protein
LLGERDKGIEIEYSKEKTFLYWANYREAKVEQKSLVLA